MLATIALFISGERNVGVAKRSADIAKEASDAAKASADVARSALIAGQRAWIKIEKIVISSPLIFTEAGVSTAVSFRLTNVGNMPAVKIRPNAWLFIMRQSASSPVMEQRRLCDEARNQPFGLGFATIFPGETFPDNVGLGAWSLGINATKAEIEEGQQATATKKHVSLYVIGCIDYTFPTDSKVHHQTRFIFQMGKNGPELISPDDGTISADSLHLIDLGIGGRDAD